MTVDLPEEWGGVIPLSVFIDEAMKMVSQAEEFGVQFRLVGGLAIRLHCQPHNLEDLYIKLKRLGENVSEITDIDGAIAMKHRGKMDKFMEKYGYIKRKMTISMATTQRKIYIHPKNWWFVDCFYGEIKFNHNINLDVKRLLLDSPTLPLAELLLGKTQIVFMNYKDVVDTVMLLLAHTVGYSDEPEKINIKHIGEKYLKKDWGFYNTVTTNLGNIKNTLTDIEELSEEQRSIVSTKIEEILEYFESIPKSRGWRGRAKVGEKKRWYNPVETTATVGEFGIFSGTHLLDKPKTKD
ncbi:MAG: hypothetical protein JSV04_13010 [Candidatus Heimdallarchaeota archaeon]|nr:MAG: hypothetical protein JSV04_13010 [Candidatus Heimdallarchaeota archaeon]